MLHITLFTVTLAITQIAVCVPTFEIQTRTLSPTPALPIFDSSDDCSAMDDEEYDDWGVWPGTHTAHGLAPLQPPTSANLDESAGQQAGLVHDSPISTTGTQSSLKRKATNHAGDQDQKKQKTVIVANGISMFIMSDCFRVRKGMVVKLGAKGHK